MRLIALAVLVFAQDESVTLKYGGKRGDSVPVKGETTLTLKLDGTEALTNMVRSAMEFLQFGKIHIRGEGVRKIVRSDKKGVETHIEYSAARVDGTFDDEPYEFDFDRTAPPEGLDKEKLKQICWFVSMGGPQTIVDPKGVYSTKDAGKDAWGEAMDLITNGLIRFSNKAVKVGEEWKLEWKGAYKQKDNDGRFAFTQKAKIEKIEDRGGKKCAVITFELAGKLDIPEAKRDKNAEKQETLAEGKGTVVIEIDSGVVRSTKSKGVVKSHFKGVDPNSGDDHELKVEFGVEGAYEEKE